MGKDAAPGRHRTRQASGARPRASITAKPQPEVVQTKSLTVQKGNSARQSADRPARHAMRQRRTGAGRRSAAAGALHAQLS